VKLAGGGQAAGGFERIAIAGAAPIRAAVLLEREPAGDMQIGHALGRHVAAGAMLRVSAQARIRRLREGANRKA
jgi:hypothetical protein